MRLLTTSSLATRVAILLVAFTLLCGCSRAEPTAAGPEPKPERSILILYLSRTGNTKALAEMIQSKVGGDLVELRTITPYPKDYRATVEQVARENESDTLPPIEAGAVDLSKYSTVFLGFPTWGMQLPPPVQSFLSQSELAGKTLVPFNTNAGYGIGNSFETVKKLAPESQVLEGYSTQGGREREGVLFVMKGEKSEQVSAELEAWLRRIGYGR